MSSFRNILAGSCLFSRCEVKNFEHWSEKGTAFQSLLKWKAFQLMFWKWNYYVSRKKFRKIFELWKCLISGNKTSEMKKLWSYFVVLLTFIGHYKSSKLLNVTFLGHLESFIFWRCFSCNFLNIRTQNNEYKMPCVTSTFRVSDTVTGFCVISNFQNKFLTNIWCNRFKGVNPIGVQLSQKFWFGNLSSFKSPLTSWIVMRSSAWTLRLNSEVGTEKYVWWR